MSQRTYMIKSQHENNDLASLKKLTLMEIADIVLTPLKDQDYLLLPETLRYQLSPTLLKNIALRLQDYTVEAVAEECLTFIADIRNINCTFGRGQLGEKFLQLSAIVNYYLRNYQKAAQSACILADIYYAANYFETNKLSLRFNLLASTAYLQCNNTAKACHHFQQFLDTNGATHFQHDWQWVSSTSQQLAESNSASKMTSEAKRKLALDSAAAGTRALFGELIPTPYTCSASTARDAMLELSRLLAAHKALSTEVRALRDRYQSEGKTPTELEKLELESKHAKACRIKLNDTDAIIDCLNNKTMVQQMTLDDIHFCLTARIFEATKLFFYHPNIISAKLKNCDAFLRFAQYQLCGTCQQSIGELLLSFTTGSERVRLYSMIYPRFAELQQIPFSGIDDQAKFYIDKAKFEAAFRQTHKKTPATLFAALLMDTTVSEEDMVKSAFSCKR